MPQWDQRYLGLHRFLEALSALEIQEFFGLSGEERQAGSIADVRRTAWAWHRKSVTCA